MPKTDAVVIFDLDGTLISVNSFPHWALYMMFGRFRGLTLSQRLWLSLRVAHLLAHRELLGTAHARIKRQLQVLWAQALEKDDSQLALQNFLAFLESKVRPNLKALLQAVASEAILATAAAGDYAQPLGRRLGFKHILTTAKNDEPDNGENRTGQKRDRVLATLQIAGWERRPRVLLTDHIDDLPLARECQLVLWFGHDAKLLAMQAQVPGVRCFSCRNASAEEILSAIQAASTVS